LDTTYFIVSTFIVGPFETKRDKTIVGPFKANGK